MIRYKESISVASMQLESMITIAKYDFIFDDAVYLFIVFFQ